MEIDIGVNYSNNYPTKDARTITVFIKNTGESPITATLQNSPNGSDFTQDVQQLNLDPDQIFSKYIRVVIHGNQSGTACIWFQLQNYASEPPCEPACPSACSD